jgi:hypothetical protein
MDNWLGLGGDKRPNERARESSCAWAHARGGICRLTMRERERGSWWARQQEQKREGDLGEGEKRGRRGRERASEAGQVIVLPQPALWRVIRRA